MVGYRVLCDPADITVVGVGTLKKVAAQEDEIAALEARADHTAAKKQAVKMLRYFLEGLVELKQRVGNKRDLSIPPYRMADFKKELAALCDRTLRGHLPVDEIAAMLITTGILYVRI